MSSLRVELDSRGDAVDLLQALAVYRPWFVQLAPDRWVVSGRVGDADEALLLLRRWAEGRRLVTVGGDLDGEPYLFDVTEAVG